MCNLFACLPGHLWLKAAASLMLKVAQEEIVIITTATTPKIILFVMAFVFYCYTNLSVKCFKIREKNKIKFIPKKRTLFVYLYITARQPG